MTCPRPTSTWQRGFTLAELLVVLAILVMLATLLPLAINRAVPSRRLEAAAQRLVTEIRLAELQSATLGRSVVVAASEDGRFTVELPSGDSVSDLSFAATEMTDHDGRPRESFTVFPDGSASGGRLQLVAGQYRATVVVSDLTGRVSVERERVRDAR